jgi:hypothetical protein
LHIEEIERNLAHHLDVVVLLPNAMKHIDAMATSYYLSILAWRFLQAYVREYLQSLEKWHFDREVLLTVGG